MGEKVKIKNGRRKEEKKEERGGGGGGRRTDEGANMRCAMHL